MKLLLLFAVLLGQTSEVSTPVIPTVFDQPYAYIGKKLTFCGDIAKGFKEDIYVFVLRNGTRAGFDVSGLLVPSTSVDGKSCFTGVLRRHDGRTALQLNGAEIFATTSHLIVRVEYFLAPA